MECSVARLERGGGWREEETLEVGEPRVVCQGERDAGEIEEEATSVWKEREGEREERGRARRERESEKREREGEERGRARRERESEKREGEREERGRGRRGGYLWEDSSRECTHVPMSLRSRSTSAEPRWLVLLLEQY